MQGDGIGPESGPELLRRAEKIRLSKAQIAREAKVDVHTVAKLSAPRERMYARTVARVRDVVIAHELAALNHLLTLHPIPEKFRRDAA
jgi:hypothetical protein